MASKLRSVLSARRAMRLNSLSLQKKFSIRWRHLYISASIWSGVARRGCCEITTLAPRSLRSAMISLLSKALSAIKAPNSIPSISGATPTVSKRCPGSSTKRTRLPRASVRARIFVVMPPLERPMACLAVPLLRSKLTTKALAARPWLTLEWLPKYTPELNDPGSRPGQAIERCWRDLKQHQLANRTSADADALARAIPDAVARLNHERQPHSSPIRRRPA